MASLKSALLAAVAITVGWAGAAQAALTINSTIGGAPTGVTLDNLDTFAGGKTGTGVTVNFQTDAAFVTGSALNLYAAPFLSGNNGKGFGAPDQPNGQDTTQYITTGSTGAFASALVELVLPDNGGVGYLYFGILWGSVDTYNTLTFYDGGTLVGTITGADVLANPNGNQGSDGTTYVNIESTEKFNRIVATSSQYAFEFDNIAYNPTRPSNVPEPASLGLLGLGLLGAGLARSRRRT